VFVIPEGGGIERRSCEEVFLTLLKAMLSENRWVSPSEHAGNMRPRFLPAGRAERIDSPNTLNLGLNIARSCA
jgi:hypothetical protein